MTATHGGAVLHGRSLDERQGIVVVDDLDLLVGESLVDEQGLHAVGDALDDGPDLAGAGARARRKTGAPVAGSAT